LADFVILDQNRLKVDPASIKKIKILKTLKESETVFELEYTIANIVNKKRVGSEFLFHSLPMIKTNFKKQSYYAKPYNF